jgi:hypothetical protein
MASGEATYSHCNMRARPMEVGLLLFQGQMPSEQIFLGLLTRRPLLRNIMGIPFSNRHSLCP